MTKSSATLRDVALAAGVSVSTASRVLNGTGRVGPSTRERVLTTAERLDFRPDALAKFFATGKSSTIGVLSREEPTAFAMQVLVGVQKALGKNDLAALLHYPDPTTAPFDELIRRLRTRRVDGVIFLGAIPDVSYPSLATSFTTPVVYAWARSTSPDDLSLVPDGVMAGRLAAEHLLSLGRRRIAHITAQAHVAAVVDRAAGLRGVLDAAGVPLVFGQPLYGHWFHAWGAEAAQRILDGDEQVDALFCGNDQIALGAHRVLRDAGVRVPDDIAIVGYDHWSRLHGMPDPFLTTIDPNLPELGAAAVDYLIQVMNGNPTAGVHAHPCTLVPGESTLGAQGQEPAKDHRFPTG